MLKVSKSGSCTAFLGKVFQCLISLMVKKFFHSKPFFFQFMPVVSYHPATYRFKKPGSILLLASSKTRSYLIQEEPQGLNLHMPYVLGWRGTETRLQSVGLWLDKSKSESPLNAVIVAAIVFFFFKSLMVSTHHTSPEFRVKLACGPVWIFLKLALLKPLQKSGDILFDTAEVNHCFTIDL